MIGPLRRRHRRTMVALAVLVPAGFWLGIAARPDWPGGAAAAAPDAAGMEAEGMEPLEGLGLLAAVGPRTLELLPTEDLQRPDVLVYLSGEPGPHAALPADAHLLGGLKGLEPRAFPLPDGASTRTLVLFSLGHQEVVGSAPLPEAR